MAEILQYEMTACRYFTVFYMIISAIYTQKKE